MNASAAEFAHLPLGDHRLAHDCKPNSRSKPLHVKVDAAGYTFHCHRCGESGGSRAQTAARRIIAPATPQPHQTLSQFGRELWSACAPIAGAAGSYLESRGCVIPPAEGDLRYNPRLPHPAGYEGPALVALVTDAVTNEPISLHRTWIQGDGRKAEVEPPRLLLKGHRKAGGVIRLWPDEAVTQGLAIAEGVETALAAAHVQAPIWAAIDAGNLAQFPVLAGIGALTIFADHDDAGLGAGRECGRRWARAGREVCMVTPNKPKFDINDLTRAA